MVRNIFPIPGKWKSHRLLCWVYWFAHASMVNLIGIRHLCWHPRFLIHDLHKPVMITLGIPYDLVKKIHSQVPHHQPKTELDFREAACDWQSSGYTKPDGLLDARETLEAYHKEYEAKMLPILDKYHF